MKCIAFCCIGIEDVVSQDIKRITGKDCESRKGCCIFDCNDISEFAYMCQSVEKVGLLLKEGENVFSISVNDVAFEIKEIFGLGCKIIGEKDYKSNDVVLDLSEKIKKKTGKKFAYKNADTNYYVEIIDEIYYFFLDLSSKELSKRDYKIFVNKASLRGTIAYAAAKIAGIEGNIVDCFCRSGEIPIEIIHFLIGKSVHFYAKDKFKLDNLERYDQIKDVKTNVQAIDSKMANLKAAEKNAKIAGVNKKIKFSRMIIADLDLKFRKNVDRLITQMPACGKESEKKIIETYRDFFETCKLIMKDDGIMCCVGLKIEPCVKIAEDNGYKIKHERSIMQGKEELKLYLFEKG